MRLLNESHSKHCQTKGCRYSWHTESGTCNQWPLLMSPRSAWVIKGRHQFFFGNNFRRDILERWKHLRCFQVDDASRMICGLHHFRSACNLDLRYNFPNNLLTLIYNSFDASRKKEHNAGKMNAIASLSRNLLPNYNFRKKGYLKVCTP